MSKPYQFYPSNLYHLFPEKKLQQWEQTGQKKHFKKGELICTPGQNNDSVNLILSGHIRVFHIHIEGKECVLGVLSKGDFLDIFNIFSERDSHIFAKALTDGEAVSIPLSEVSETVEQSPELAMTLLKYFSSRLLETVDILEQVAYSKVEERLNYLLQNLASTSDSVDKWSPIPSYLTHKDLAGMIASTRETVTFLLNKLSQTGQIKQEDQRIWVKMNRNM
ncbi:MAG: Crp/Fnr family transcriptional regulator [Bacillaceae bacterium]|nr:Crp/Fnr family transcriptional regulator [Bacillaceae bacterium]